MTTAATFAFARSSVRDAGDERDQAIARERSAELDTIPGPRVGDWVEFSDGTERRISHLWPDGAQTSDGGSYYLGGSYVSMSGSLWPCVPLDSLTPTERKRDGWVWFFHHNYVTAHNGVHTQIPFRVFTCALPAPR